MFRLIYRAIFRLAWNGSVYEPKNVARKTTNTSNKLRVVYDYTVL